MPSKISWPKALVLVTSIGAALVAYVSYLLLTGEDGVMLVGMLSFFGAMAGVPFGKELQDALRRREE